MEESKSSLFRLFLQTAHDEQSEVNIFLLTGVRLVGKIRTFDDTCMVISSKAKGIDQLILYRAILTIE